MQFREVVEQAAKDCLASLDLNAYLGFAENLRRSLVEASHIPKEAEAFVATLKILHVDLNPDDSLAELPELEAMQHYLSRLKSRLVLCGQLRSQAKDNETLTDIAEIIHTSFLIEAELIESTVKTLSSVPGKIFITLDDLEKLCDNKETIEDKASCACGGDGPCACSGESPCLK